MRYSALNNQGGLGRLNHGPEGGVLGDDVSPGLSVVVSDVAPPDATVITSSSFFSSSYLCNKLVSDFYLSSFLAQSSSL